MAIKDPERLVEIIVGHMREQAREARVSRAEVDVSGGVDSAVVAGLAVRAFGATNVVGVYGGVSSSEISRRRARLVAQAFGFPLVELDLTSVYTEIVRAVEQEFARLGLPFPDASAPANRTMFGGLRSCLRAPVGRFVNRAFGGGLRQGTGNRDEDEFLRFFQKGGDGEVDANWISALHKSEVWELAAHLGVPAEIVTATPSPDLWGVGDRHTDEGELRELTGVALTYTRPGGPLGTLEWVSRENAKNGCVVGANAETPPAELGYTPEQGRVIEAVRHLERISRHKAQLPPEIPRAELVRAGAVT